MESEKVLDKIYSQINNAMFQGTLPIVTFIVTRGAKAKNGWSVKKGERYYQIYAFDECLFESDEEIYMRIMHQIVHILNMENDIKDTSRAMQYHNKKFKEVSEGFGLTTEYTASRGYDTVGITEEALEKIRLDDMRRQLNDAIEVDIEAEQGRQPHKRRIRFICPICKREAMAEQYMKLQCGYCLVPMEEKKMVQPVKKQ